MNRCIRHIRQGIKKKTILPCFHVVLLPFLRVHEKLFVFYGYFISLLLLYFKHHCYFIHEAINPKSNNSIVFYIDIIFLLLKLIVGVKYMLP